MCGSLSRVLWMLITGTAMRDARARTAVRLPDVRPARLVQLLQEAGAVRQADFGELARDHPAAALEHAEDVGRRNRLPGRQRVELREDPLLLHEVGRLDRIDHGGRPAVLGVDLAQQIALERQDAVVVGGSAPQHRRGGHQAALRRLDRRQVAGAAGLARHAIVAGVHEADEFARFAIEQRVALRGIGARRELPGMRIAGQDMRRVPRGDVGRVGRRRVARLRLRGVAAMAIGAAQDDGRVRMHRRVVGGRVAAHAPLRLAAGIGCGLLLGRRRLFHVGSRHRLFLGAGECQRGEPGQEQRRDGAGHSAEAAARGADLRPPGYRPIAHQHGHQKVNTRLARIEYGVLLPPVS